VLPEVGGCSFDDRAAAVEAIGQALHQTAAVVPVTDEEDPELAAYNRFLARLNEDAGSAPRDRAREGRPAAERGAQ